MVCMTLRWRDWLQMANETATLNFHELADERIDKNPMNTLAICFCQFWQAHLSKLWLFWQVFCQTRVVKNDPKLRSESTAGGRVDVGYHRDGEC